MMNFVDSATIVGVVETYEWLQLIDNYVTIHVDTR
jgi:hypothetical protein